MKKIQTIAVIGLALFIGLAAAAPGRAVAQQLDQRTADALTAALNDEYKAEALYAAIIARHGEVRPFSNIINAEQRHSAMLIPLFEKYGVTVPTNDWASKVEAPDSLLEACEQGVSAEVENVALYDEFLNFVTQQDIREVFVYLRNASRDNHQPAFQRCVERGGEMPGRGQGQGGQGQGGGGRGR
ncbi:MAG: DUF2202 domain-containing protein [Candidatus Alcyoniella australis]|nr:DUF2202 domain-containing protein [Candidatus Alcyoniella australis]